MNEIWRSIKGFPDYEVSNFGRVRSFKRNGELIRTLARQKSGYMEVNLSANGKVKKQLVHRLVAEAFVPNIHGKPCVNHINCDRSDNRPENLEWVTHKENSEWMIKCGRTFHDGGLRKKPVVATSIKDGTQIAFPSTAAVASHGFWQASVWKCCVGRQRQHKGYLFRFAK